AGRVEVRSAGGRAARAGGGLDRRLRAVSWPDVQRSAPGRGSGGRRFRVVQEGRLRALHGAASSFRPSRAAASALAHGELLADARAGTNAARNLDLRPRSGVSSADHGTTRRSGCRGQRGDVYVYTHENWVAKQRTER